MTKRIPIGKIAVILIVIYACLLGFVYHYTWPCGDISHGKQVGDVYIEPAYGMDISNMTPVETYVIAPEDLSFHTRMVILAFAISPFVLGVYQILLALQIIPVFGFRTVNKDNILYNNKRKNIWRIVKEHPGMSSNELEEMTDHIKGNFRYHLQMLLRHGYLEKYQINGFIGYFEAGISMADPEKNLIMALKSKKERDIYSILQKNKGISRKELSERLNISGSTVTWHIKRLISLGIVNAQYSGKSVSYCLSDDQTPDRECDSRAQLAEETVSLQPA